jgi:anti-anti-sigma factor
MVLDSLNLRTSVVCVPTKTLADAFDVTVTGPLVLSTTPLLHAVLNGALDTGARRIAIDLHEVTDLDTAGLATLIMTARRLRACNGSLAFTSLSPDCEALMERLHLFANERQAALGSIEDLVSVHHADA